MAQPVVFAGWCIALLGGVALMVQADPPAATQPEAAGTGRGHPSTSPSDARSGPGGYGRGIGVRAWPGDGKGRAFDANRPGGPFGSGSRGGPNDQALTPEEKVELLAFLEEHFPEVHGRLRRFEQQDPAKYNDAMRRLTGPMRKVMHLSKADPRLADVIIAEHKVEMKIADLQASLAADRDEGEREKIRTRLRGLVSRRFDLRQQRLTMEIEGMRKRLDEAKARLSQQAANRSEWIEAETRRVIHRAEAGAPGRTGRLSEDEGARAAPGQSPSGTKRR